MRKFLGMISAFCLLAGTASAQGEKHVREGNKLYEQKKFKEAGSAYQQALLKNPTYVPGMFNLGNTLYQQKQYEASRKVLDAAAKNAKDKNSKSGVNYNIGNTYMSEKKWEDAIASYKKALRANPQDADAKYNLSYAQAMLKKDQQDNKDNKDKKDQNKDQNKDNKDNKDKDKDKGDKDKKDKQDKGDQDKDKQDKDQKPEPQPSKLSQQQAEQLLNALQQEEKKLQDKMQKEKGVPVKTDKDW